MKIRLGDLRQIIREELEAAYKSEQVDEGIGKVLGGAALAAALAFGAMKGGRSADTDQPEQSQSQSQSTSTQDASKIQKKVDGMSKDQIKEIIAKIKSKVSDKRFKLALDNLEKQADSEGLHGLPEVKLGLKTFATDTSFAHHQLVADTILSN